MAGASSIKVNSKINLDKFNKIHTNEYDAKNSTNVLKVDKSKTYYEDANLELFQIDVDKDGKMDDVYRIDKILDDGTRVGMGFVNKEEIELEPELKGINPETDPRYQKQEALKGDDRFKAPKVEKKSSKEKTFDPNNKETLIATPEKKSIVKTAASAGLGFLEGMTSLGEKI